MPNPSKERRYPRLPTTKKSKVQEEIERMLEDTDSTENDVSIKTDDLLQDKSSFTQDYIPKDSEDIKTQEEEDVSPSNIPSPKSCSIAVIDTSTASCCAMIALK